MERSRNTPDKGRDLLQPLASITESPSANPARPNKKLELLLQEARLSPEEFEEKLSSFHKEGDPSHRREMVKDIRFLLRNWDDTYSKDLRSFAYQGWPRELFKALLNRLGEETDLSPEDEEEQAALAEKERQHQAKELLWEIEDLKEAKIKLAGRLRQELYASSHDPRTLEDDLREAEEKKARLVDLSKEFKGFKYFSKQAKFVREDISEAEKLIKKFEKLIQDLPLDVRRIKMDLARQESLKKAEKTRDEIQLLDDKITVLTKRLPE